MVDVSIAGSSQLPGQTYGASASKTAERAVGERKQAVDSDIERQETERAENRAQDRANQAQIHENRAAARQAEADQGRGQRVDLVA